MNYISIEFEAGIVSEGDCPFLASKPPSHIFGITLLLFSLTSNEPCFVKVYWHNHSHDWLIVSPQEPSLRIVYSIKSLKPGSLNIGVNKWLHEWSKLKKFNLQKEMMITYDEKTEGSSRLMMSKRELEAAFFTLLALTATLAYLSNC